MTTGRRMLIGAALAGLATLPLAGPAAAKNGDVRVTKACSGPSDIKIKLSPEDGRLEVEIEVDQNRNGVQWTWTLLRGQRQLATGKATTRRPSGSFEVRRVVNDNNGTDTLTAKATRASGERCTVTARI